MSSAIINHYSNKDVRTEVRIEQRESQIWPAITICPMETIHQHFTCQGNMSVFGNASPHNICSKQIKLPYVYTVYSSPLHHDVKDRCMVFNLNGTLTHQGGASRGLDITFYDHHYSIPDGGGFALFFYDAKTIGSHVFNLYDIDLSSVSGTLKSEQRLKN